MILLNNLWKKVQLYPKACLHCGEAAKQGNQCLNKAKGLET